MDFRDIVRNAAKQKLLELAKTYLDIIDELKKEDAAKVQKILAIAEESGFEEASKTLEPFLYLIDDNKKEIVRKRILDKTNALIRELEQ